MRHTLLMISMLCMALPAAAQTRHGFVQPGAISDQPGATGATRAVGTGMIVDQVHLAGLATLEPAPDQAATGPEHRALVVGVDEYTHLNNVMRAVSDAEALGSALEAVGFGVTRVFNSNTADTQAALDRFFSGLGKDDAVIIYLSGHGGLLQHDSALLMADAPMPEDDVSALQDHALGLNALWHRVENSRAGPVAVIFDSCRTSLDRGTDAGTGSGYMPPASRDWLLIYTSEAERCPLETTGKDDRSDRSLFMRALLPFLSEPGISLQEAVMLAYPQIMRLSDRLNYRQRPVLVDTLSGAFLIDPAAARYHRSQSAPAGSNR